MTVRELLVQLAPTLLTHEVCTRWASGYACTLRIDIEHNHTFHACAEISRRDIQGTYVVEHLITSHFEKSFYKSYNSKDGADLFLSVLDDFKVNRWSLNCTDDVAKLWTLSVGTHQT